MSAHFSAPGFRRPQAATAAYSATAETFSGPSVSTAHPVRRRALAVAAAMLCAPVLAAGALAAIGASGGTQQAGMGSLAGTHGLKGSTVPAATPSALSSSVTPDPTKQSSSKAFERGSATTGSRAPSQRPVHSQTPSGSPSRKAGTRAPAHQTPTAPSGTTRTHTGSAPQPSVVTDPTQPGAPAFSGDGGSTSSGTNSTGTSNYTSDGRGGHSGGD
jgi:hypothetical protein